MSTTMLDQLRQKRDECLERMDAASNRLQALPSDAPDEEREALKGIFDSERGAVERLTDDVRRQEIVLKARADLAPQDNDERSEKPAKNGEARHARPRGSSAEPLTYRKRGPANFFDDVVRAQIDGDATARARLAAHAQEMRVEMRDISSTAGGGGEFIAPLYLQDEWIRLARAGRVTANLMNNRELPAGANSITLPKLATGAATAVQTADNAAVQETDPTTAGYNFGVKTIAGQVDLSRQLYDLSSPGMDEVITEDLANDYATKLDIQVISGSGSAGQALGIRNISGITTTASGSTATVAAIYPKLASAWASVNAAIYRPADAIVMHPRRWAFFQAAVDSTGRPLASAVAPQNAVARGDGIVAEGLAGNILGLPVYVDPNIPTNLGAGTNEDIMLVLRTSELYLYERGTPFTRVFEDVGSGTLTVRISLWNYFAFGGGRYPGAISVITGTALVTPTF